MGHAAERLWSREVGSRGGSMKLHLGQEGPSGPQGPPLQPGPGPWGLKTFLEQPWVRVPGLESDTPLNAVPVPLLFARPPTHLPSFIHPSSTAHLSAHSLSHSAALSPTHLSVLQPTHTSNQTTYLSIRPPPDSAILYPSVHSSTLPCTYISIHPPPTH